MTTETASTTSAKDVGLGGDDASSGASAAFSDRVRLYLKVTTLINLTFAVVAVTFMLAGIDPQMGGEHDDTRIFLICLVTSTNGLAWFAIARSRHSMRTALLTEAVGTLVLAGTYSYVILMMAPNPERADQVLALLLVTIVLVLRASLIPAPTVATTIIGLLSVSFPVALSLHVLPDLEFVYHFWIGVMGAVVVTVTTVTSFTIYGLHRRMQVAKRLGQYQLDHRVGQGGMGEVYLAQHSLLQRPTAIKLLRDVTSASARARFRQEVQTASGLTHPNTVEIYDYGRTPDGIFYFAMEYIEGASLEETVAATGAMPPARVVRLLEQAAGSLSEAHGRGLVHRDVKPSNLMLCERGGQFDTLKVLDFGLVRDLSEAEDDKPGVLTGTPLYMAPEAILDDQGFIPESDVYALGATAYFLLTGKPPFASGDLVEVLSDHLATAPPRPESSDAELADLIVRCLSKDPSDRPSDAARLLNALKRCSSRGGWSNDDAKVWWAEHREIVEATRVVESERSSRSGGLLGRRTASTTGALSRS